MSQGQHGLPHLDPQQLRKRHVQLIRFRQCNIVLLNSAKTNCYDQFAYEIEVLGFAQMLTFSLPTLVRDLCIRVLFCSLASRKRQVGVFLKGGLSVYNRIGTEFCSLIHHFWVVVVDSLPIEI